ncbi:MAG: HDOD domain-containing protein [Fimbriimonadaceae bacterium]|nr:HDOD domain-containing protein [Fimbriimonadaceae bacterium]
MNNNSNQPFSIRALSRAMVDLPALPTVVLQVMKAAENENATTSEIEGYILGDSALCIKLLKVVNSAYFGLPRQVTSIGQAIGILGLARVRSLVLTVGVLNALSNPNPKTAKLRTEFWKWSLTAAAGGQACAKQMGLDQRSQESAFIGALLSDLGRLFLLSLFPKEYEETLIEAMRGPRPLYEVEQRALGMDHATLGDQLSQKWGFPVKLTEVVRTHEFPDADNYVAYCAHAGDRLAAMVTNPDCAETVWPWDAKVKSWLSAEVYSDSALEQLRKKLEESEALLKAS